MRIKKQAFLIFRFWKTHALQILWKAALWIVHVYPQTPEPTSPSSTPRRLFLSFTARHSPNLSGVQESTTTPWHQSIRVNWQWKYLEGKQPFIKSRFKPGHIGLLKKVMSTPQRKYLGLQMNRYSFFFLNVLFFFGELVVLKCFGPQLWGNLMDVQQPHCAENSIKICSLCFDTIFRLQANAHCASGAFFSNCDQKQHLSTCLSNHWVTFCSQGNTGVDLWPCGSLLCCLMLKMLFFYTA